MNPEKHFIMRKLFTLLFLIASFPVWAQQYNNEWIKHSQPYYKFNVSSTGIYRIPKSLLDNAGIGGISVQFLELWRNGKLVPIYPSVPSGPLPANGYIEFWGEANDGVADNPLYRDSLYQHSKKVSLLTDIAAYFLSVNTSQTGKFHVDIPNDVASNILPVEPYFMHTVEVNFRNKLNPGFAAVIGEYVYSSSYDKGEFWSSDDVKPGVPLTHNISNLHVNNTVSPSYVKFGAAGNALNTRSILVDVNGTTIANTVMDYFNDLHTSIPISTSLISSGNISFNVSNTSPISTDRMVVSYYEITYPSQFNFGNNKNYGFKLPAKSAGYYLEIANFNYGASAPVLYNLTSGQRFVGDISSPGTIKFAIPGSAFDSEFVLVNTEAGNIATVGSLTAKNFIPFDNASNQGQYLIITHPSLFVGSHGNNPIQEYKDYRASAAGGGHSVQVIDIDELVDQFAFGIKKHPLSIKNFIRYARDKFAQKPENVFLIGHGMTYKDFRYNEFKPEAEKLNLIPTFGLPASDNMLSSEGGGSSAILTPIGRLSVINGKELEDYLEKVKEYESVQKTAPNTVTGRAWMKNFVHVAGSSDPYLGTVLCHYMSSYRQIIEDTLYGGKVSSFCKTSTDLVENVSSEMIRHLFEEGISVLTYFGHSSSTTLEFNLDNPNAYDNKGKYPVFFVNGCNAGNFFNFYPQRLTVNETLSEKFVLAKQRGSIAFVASTHFGIVNYLNLFLHHLYNYMGHEGYGSTLGELNQAALGKMVNSAGPYDYYARFHAEEVTLHGDPGLVLNVQPKPDYVIEEPTITINPTFISIAEKTFKLKVKFLNIGKASNDSLVVEIKQIYPDGTSSNIFRDKLAGIDYADSLTFNIPINSVRDKGLNKIIVTLDADLAIDEITKANNTATKEIFIFEDEGRPVYPYAYAIIDNPSQKLYASTANPLSLPKSYTLEVDTTELFNSSVKISQTLTSPGGLLEFTPGITYKDSVVYYWRVSVTPKTGDEYRWIVSSFMYVPSVEGSNQSHYHQHLNSETQRLSLDTNRQWTFGERVNNLFVRNSIFGPAGQTDNDFSVVVNGQDGIASACVGNSLIFNVFDPVTFRPWRNVDDVGNNLYRFGSGSANCKPSRNWNFEFSYMNEVNRKKMMDMMDSIPIGAYVVVRSIYYSVPHSFSSTWRADTALYGSNNSLYHKLLFEGLIDIDSINKPQAWIFIYKKGDNSFQPKYKINSSINDFAVLEADCKTPDTLGFITSPKFGPAKNWKQVIWDGRSLENPSHDNPTVDIIGVDTANNETTLYTLNKSTHNFDISSVSAVNYPYMRLRMRNADSIGITPYQLDYWRIHFTPVQEGALAPNLFFISKDTLEVGEPVKFGVAFKNISKAPFDSIAVKVTVLDKDNTTRDLRMSKQKPLLTGDTAILRFELDSKNYIGINTLFVEFNPNNDQPEQYHFNNFLYHNFYVKADLVNPLLDVTFDGVHILNRDIVSAKPHIQIKLKDEAKFLLLNDTALNTVQIRHPDGSLRTYQFDNDTLRFNPATTGDDNTATIDFYPAFSAQINPEGDEYELIVTGKDQSGNKSGTSEYRVTFKVISKPMISNLLNYPNPFTTSTAFVFTITGSEIPQNLKIQILTVTGKIVREITKDELGPLRIGRNITEFKWNGTDQFGQRLANGVYLYRFVTNLNGKQMDKYKAAGDNTDKYFTNGYGKMYLMR